MRFIKTKSVYPVLLTILLLMQFPPFLTAQTADYEMLVSSRNTNSVKRFNGITGAYIDDFITPGSGGLSVTQDLTTTADGNILVSGRGNTGVLLYDKLTGDFIRQFTSGYALDNPTKITFGQDGFLYVSQWGTSKNKVVRFDGSTGVFIDEFTPSINLGLGHAWDTEGNLYVACYGSKDVRRYDSEGNFLGVFCETGHLQGPTNLWFDGKGSLFVIDWILGSVIQFNASTGAFIKVFADGLQNAEGYAFGPDSNLYICDWSRNQIRKYSPGGNYINIFTSQGGMQAPNSILFRQAQVTGIKDETTGSIPGNFLLYPNYPNPFNSSTNIRFYLNSPGRVKTNIYNQAGQLVETLFDENKSAGTYNYKWRPQKEIDESSGIYFVRLISDNYSQTIKMIYLK